MLDSVNAEAIPPSAQMVAGYVDGLYRWTDASWGRFPNAVKVRIAVHASTNDGVVGDVENGDMTPAQAVGWVLMRRHAGVDPTIYCSLAIWDAVRSAFRGAGVAEPHYWIAAYPDIGPQLYPGSVAHQYADHGPHGENYDTSVVADYWPGVDQKEEDMTADEHQMLVEVHGWLSYLLKGAPEQPAPTTFAGIPRAFETQGAGGLAAGTQFTAEVK